MSRDLTAEQRASRALAGRQTFRLTPERFERVVELTRIGNYAQVAAAAAGLSERVFYRYLSTGRDVDARLAEIYGDDHWLDETQVEPPHGAEIHANDWMCWRLGQAIGRARAEAEAYAVGVVRKAMPDHHEAAEWWLERGHARRWKRRDGHELEVAERQGDDDDLLDVEASELMHEALRAAARARELPPAPDVVEGTAREVERADAGGA